MEIERFKRLASLTMKDIGADAGAARRLGGTRLAATYFGELLGLCHSEPDPKINNGEPFVGIEGKIFALTYDCRTGAIVGRHRSRYAYLPRCFREDMLDVARKCQETGELVSFRLEVGIEPGRYDGKWSGYSKIQGGDQAEEETLQRLAESLGINLDGQPRLPAPSGDHVGSEFGLPPLPSEAAE